jgi:hypothetical protein
MKRFSFFLIVLLITRIGTSYAAPNAGAFNIQNFFLGQNAKGNVNVNQVLALLVGPQGKPGPAGVAGKDGFVGLNGQQGLQGAPGPQGPAGTSIATVAVPVGDPNCLNGGAKFIAGSGAATFACNGAPGPAGPAGAQGAPGTNGKDGTGNGSTGTFTQGVVTAVSCSDTANIRIVHHFDNRENKKDFLLDAIAIKGLSKNCFKPEITFSLTMAIKKAPLYYKYATYSPELLIRCTATMPGPDEFNADKSLRFSPSTNHDPNSTDILD